MLKCTIAQWTVETFFHKNCKSLYQIVFQALRKASVECNHINDFYRKQIMANNRYCIGLAKLGTAGCKNCKDKIPKGTLRIGKIVPNPFTEAGGDMKQWYHARCAFEALSRAKATTKKIEAPDDLEGFDEVSQEHKDEVLKYIEEFATSVKKTPVKAKKAKPSATSSLPSISGNQKLPNDTGGAGSLPSSSGRSSQPGKDDLFKEFRRLLVKISDESTYTGKTAIVADFFEKGSDGKGFKGDLFLWVKLLLPGVIKRVYNLQNRQLIKLFSQIFKTNQKEMMEDLEEGDVAETIRLFFESSNKCPPAKKATLTLQQVDAYLEDLSGMSREEEQLQLLQTVAKKCTGNDLKIFIRLVKHDLRIQAGAKHILSAIHPTAYDAFQASRNLNTVLEQYLERKQRAGSKKEFRVKASLMTPVLPMLAQICKTADEAFKKCPNGVFAEIKYDGERVQVHKRGSEFSYFSRSLKPVMAYKVLHFKDYIPKAFPYGNDLILDSEILLVNSSGKPLPFGSLGAHKQKKFVDATVCLFIFDCLQFNDENLMGKPLIERREILQENIKPVKNHIMLSELKFVKDREQLKKMITSVKNQGLEGLVVKDKMSIYEPGKRHWLKIKKDYLKEGGMADSADLVVLGAFYGSGNKGGMMSIFLMGCLNTKTEKWCTVTKVHTGHDDPTLAKLQNELKMVKISKDPSKVPSWLDVNRTLVPDFIAEDPEKSQVWEITGDEFTKANVHTAAGLSIRFPRVARIRWDKTPKNATTLQELQAIYEKSKVTTDLIGLSSLPESKQEESSSGSDSRTPSPSPTKTTPKSSPEKTSQSSSPARKRSSSPKPGHQSRKKKLSSPSPQRSSSPKPGHQSRKKKLSSPSPQRSSSPKPGRQIRKKRSSPSPQRLSSPKPEQQSRKKRRSSPSPSPKVDEPESSSKAKKSPEKLNFDEADAHKLPDIFSNVKISFPSSLKEFDILRRYFIAYGGVILQEYEKANATHVISSDTEKVGQWPKHAARITVDWLWDCIKLQKMVPSHFYQPVKIT